MPIAYLLLIFFCVLVPGQSALALEGSKTSLNATLDLKAHLSFGVIHDSNVSIKEIDSQLEESDSANMLEMGISARTKIGKAEMGVSYNFSQTKYQSFSEFDRESKLLGLELSGSHLGWRQGLSYHRANAKLGNEDFLELERWSPYVSRFLTRRLYLRGSFINQDKTIIPRSGQSSESKSVTLDLYYFRNGLRNYFNVSGIIREEKATTTRYNNRAEIIRLRMLGRIRANKRSWRYEFSWAYEQKDFKEIWPRSNNERLDKRHSIRVKISYPFSKSITGEIFTNFVDSDSSVSYASFDENIVGIKFTYTLD